MRLSTPRWVSEGTALDVAVQVLINGPISRADIARRLHLSAGTLTRLTQPLLETGLLVEVGELVSGQVGRPSRLLDVVPTSRHFIGIKLTGDHALGVITDLRANVVRSERADLDGREPPAVIATVARLITTLAASAPAITAVGVGIGGLVGSGGTVISAPFLGWPDVDLAAALEAETGLPVLVANDVTAFTEYERWFGGGRNLDRFAVITVGAGVGYGLVAGGEVVESEDSGLGLVGHWLLDPFGPLCAEGHRGCAQTVLASAGVSAALSGALGREIGYDEALTLAEHGEPSARSVVDGAGRGLGQLVAAVANLTMPQAVILGGEGVRLASVAGPAIQAGIAEHRNPRATPIELVTTSGDDSEWCRGAAVLALVAHVLGPEEKS
ncbi:MAG: ROK family transcriptional regulator [Actinomycetales bacterium]|nr:ROK family transcriptional regulator [Actinomycetales bacterium]